MFEFDLFSWHYPLLILAGFIAGFINTMAGWGSLLTLPLLIFLGLPSAVANGTNRIAIFMSAFSATAGFKSKGVSNYPFNAYLGFAGLLGALIGAQIAIDIEGELFNQFQKDNQDNGNNLYRLTMKLNRKIKKNNEIGVFYRIQKDIDRIEPVDRKIIGLKYSHKFDLTK